MASKDVQVEKRPPTYREIARMAGTSIFSVSCALSNRPGISKASRARIKAIAKEAGYRPNPFVTALMTQHRRPTATRRLRAIIVCLMSAQTERLMGERPALRERFEGIREACEATGFFLEKLHWEDFGGQPRRLFASLRGRRSPGVVFMGGEVPEWCLSGWDTYAMASVGNRRLNLPCHYASTDDYRAMWIALETLAARGYRRPGLAMERSQHVIRSDYRGLAAFLAWHAQRGETRPPLCWTEKWDRGEFSRWRERERPDVVLAIERAPLDFLREAGAEVPGEVGFAHLDLDETTEGISGIRQLNREAGRSAAHLVIDQINRVTYGRPAHPRSIQITGEWCDGGTVAGLKT